MDRVVCFDCVIEFFENIFLEEAIKISDQEKEEIAKLFMDELLAIISLLIQDNHKQFDVYVNSLQTNRVLKETVLEKSNIQLDHKCYSYIYIPKVGVIRNWCMLKYATLNSHKYRDHWAHKLSLHMMEVIKNFDANYIIPNNIEAIDPLLSSLLNDGVYDQEGNNLSQVIYYAKTIFEDEAIEYSMDELENIAQLFINELPLIKEQLSQYDHQRCMEYIKTV